MASAALKSILNGVINPRWPYHQNLLAANNFVSGWTATASTLTPGYIAGPGGMAARVIEDTASADHSINIAFTKAASAIAYEFLYAVKMIPGVVRAGGGWIFNGSFSSGIFMRVNLQTGEVFGTSAFGSFTNISYSTRNLGNGWWLVSRKFTTDAVANLSIYIHHQDGPHQGDGVSGMYVAGGIVRLQ